MEIGLSKSLTFMVAVVDSSALDEQKISILVPAQHLNRLLRHLNQARFELVRSDSLVSHVIMRQKT